MSILRTSILLSVLGLARVGHADVPEPAMTAPLSSWTPVQQWMPVTNINPRYQYGYGSSLGAAVLADELGDHLAELGRASLIEECLGSWSATEDAALTWAVCGHDVAVLDMKKLEAELVAENVAPETRAQIIARVNQNVATAKKVGAVVEDAAKDDPGIASVIKLGDDARTEWAAFAAANREAIDRHLALKDAVRSGKTNDKGFAGCFEATQVPFAKIVHATKVPAEVSGDPLPSYFALFMTTTEGYIASVSYAACALGQDEHGASLYIAAASQDDGRVRIGPRSLTIAKAYAATFKPKFATRSIDFNAMKTFWHYGINVPGLNPTLAIMTPGGGTVGTMKADGATTKVTFKGNSVMECGEWRSTGKVNGVNPDGSVSYEQKCVERHAVPNQSAAVEVPTKYLGGITPGVSMITVNQFPAVVWKGTKVTGVLGVAAK